MSNSPGENVVLPDYPLIFHRHLINVYVLFKLSGYNNAVKSFH